MNVLVRTNSEEDIKTVRAEFKRLNLKFNEDENKTLRNHIISEENLNILDLSKVFIFKRIFKDNKVIDLSMLISQNPLKWNR